jgi:large subunit ribosomal protein L23
MRDVYDVVYRPVVTEKTTDQMEASLYTFVVNEKANKLEIAEAVETLWDVSVLDVRTMRYPGKLKRAMMGRMTRNAGIGRRPSFKKAVVQLAEGEHIEFYEVG